MRKSHVESVLPRLVSAAYDIRNEEGDLESTIAIIQLQTAILDTEKVHKIECSAVEKMFHCNNSANLKSLQ